MRVVVVYESFFGATREVAEAIAEGIRGADPAAVVGVLRVTAAPADLAGTDLLVVGGPTHLLGLSSRPSRWLAAQYWGDPRAPRRRHRPHGRPLAGPSLRSGLRTLPSTGPGTRAAVFDTRRPGPLTGGAGPVIARRLRGRGAVLVAAPQDFHVDGVTGPLRAGERNRATAWGARLVTAAHPGGRVATDRSAT
jgi:hypothetical protein